jgi:NitT/TauT family transport system substrate-binding protein
MSQRLLSSPASGERARRAGALAPAVLVLLAVAVLLVTWLPFSGGRAVEPLRVGINPWPGYEFAMLAQSLGYFEDEGVDVRMVELSSLGDCRRAFERGQIDGMFGTMVEVMVTERAGAGPLAIVLAADYSAGADRIVARAGIGSVAALRGRTIAAEPGTLTEFILSRALHESGLDLADVRVRWMPAIEMVDAFEAGTIDAAVCYPPISVLMLAGGGESVFDTTSLPGVVLDVLAFSPSVASAREAEIAAFCRAFFRAQEYASRHPEAYASMALRQGITPDAFVSAITDGIEVLGGDAQRDFIGDGARLAEIRRIIGAELDRLDRLDRRVEPWAAVEPDGRSP